MRTLIVANWKMNPPVLKEAEKLFNDIKEGVKNIKDAKVVICPSFPYISNLKSENSNLKLGAQNCFWEEKGAFTGEVSPQMLKDLGVEYVILGHSERRKYLGETDEMINKKLKKALELGLLSILCVGDKDRETKGDMKEIDLQLETALRGLENYDLSKLTITYEPVWAISTTEGGAAATPEDTKEAVFYIKNYLNVLIGKDKTSKIRIIYGGSVNSQNINSFIKAGVDGALVGAASLKAEEFINVVKNASNV